MTQMTDYKYAKEYFELIDSKQIIVSDEIKLLVKKFKEDIKNNDIYLNKEELEDCIRFSEEYFYKLLPYQKFIYTSFFMYYKSDNTLVYDTHFLYMGRGNGKDGLLEPLFTYLTSNYNILNYDIYMVANNEDQAKIPFEDMRNFIDKNNNLRRHFYTSNTKIANNKTKSIIKYVTSNSKTKDGRRPGLVYFNEIHAYENYDDISVHKSGLGKKTLPRTIYASTDGYVREGPLDDLLNQSLMVLNGELKNIRLFPFICRLNDKEEIDDPMMWEKANPSINYFVDLKRQIESDYELQKINHHLTPEFLTKRMNLPTKDEEKTVATEENIKATNREMPDLSGYTCVGGIDYADVTDFCSCILLFKKDGCRYLKHHSFICSNSRHLKLIKYDLDLAIRQGLATIIDAPTITPEVVVDWFAEQSKNYNIKSIALDTFRYNVLKEAFDKIGFYPRDKEHKEGKLCLVRNGSYTHNQVAPQIDEMFSNKRIIWGDDSMMRWYTNNTSVKIDGKGNKTYNKIEYQSRKNDGFMALVHAMTIDNEIPNTNTKIDLIGAIGF